MGRLKIRLVVLMKTYSKKNTLLSYGDHFGAYWCILVHFVAPHTQPHDPSMTCSDSSTLPSVHLLQFWITQNQWITQQI